MLLPLLRPFGPALLVALLVAVAAGALSDAGASSAARIATGATVHPGVRHALAQSPRVRVLVTLRQPPALRAPRLDVDAVRSQVASAQAAVLQDLPTAEFDLLYRYQALPALAGQVSEAGLEALAQDPNVEEIALDGEGSAATTQSLPLIHAAEAHTSGLTGAGIIVAVLDSGIDTDHADLSDNIAFEACFLAGGGCPGGPHPAEDDHGHGTNVSGIITSKGTVAPLGVAPDAGIAAYKILNSAGTGFFSDWAAALDDIIANHPEVDIVNMSLQSSLDCALAGPVGDAITALRKQGVPTFISSGNHGTKNSFTVPSCITDGLSVGAAYDANVGTVNGWKTACTDSPTSADLITCWSDSDSSLDLLAPGARITSTGRGGGTSTFIGTSQAAPHAAGVAALLLKAAPGLSVDDIELRLEATGMMLTDDLNDSDDATSRMTPRVDARVALATDLAADYDGDGCPTGQEFGPNEQQGGQRNPVNEWDYFNPTKDGLNRVDDVLIVLRQYFVDQGNANYTEQTDRSQIGPNAWNLGPPDGLQRVDDVLMALAQYFHDC